MEIYIYTKKCDSNLQAKKNRTFRNSQLKTNTERKIVARKRPRIYDNNLWKDKRRHTIQLLLAILSLFAHHIPQLGIYKCAVLVCYTGHY